MCKKTTKRANNASKSCQRTKRHIWKACGKEKYTGRHQTKQKQADLLSLNENFNDATACIRELLRVFSAQTALIVGPKAL